MLHIYYARENVDKERFLFDRCAEDALLLVPDQYTLQAEKEALSYLQEKGLLHREVLSFSRLGSRILQEAGGGKRPMIDRYGRHMILRRIMARHREALRYYGGYGENTAFLEMLNDMISQMKQYGATPDTLDEVVEEMGEDEAYLRGKLLELRLLFGEYEEAIRGKYVDTEDLVTLQCERLKDSPSATGRQVLIYGFDYFTPSNLRMLEALLAVNREVAVVLTLDEEDESGLFALGAIMKRRLIEAAERQGASWRAEAIPDTYALTQHRPALSFLETQLFAASPARYAAEPEGVTLVRAANYYAEAETAAQRILELVREEGYRYRDIALICNDLSTRGSIYKRVFAGYGLPLFLDQKRDVLTSPAVAYLSALLRIVTKGYRRTDVLALLKTGLAGMDAELAATFENYCTHYHIDGKRFRAPFIKGKDHYDEATFAAIERQREAVISPIGTWHAAFRDAETVRDKAVSLLSFLEEDVHLAEVMQALVEEQLAQGDGESAQETAQIWNVAMEILDQMVAVMGEERISMTGFADLFRAGVEAVEIGVLPPTVDGLVLGTMQRTRTGRVKALFVLGANEGILPADVRAQDVLTEEEKTYLLERDVALCKMDRLRLMEEHLAIYRNLTRASRELWMSYAVSDGAGESLMPSSVYETLQEIFPTRKEQRDVENQDAFLPLVGGTRSTLEHVGRYFREKTERLRWGDPAGESGVDPAAAEALLWYREQRPGDAAKLEAAIGYRNMAMRMEPEVAGALYLREGEEVLSLSPSRLEQYGNCPFAHFVHYGLHPEEPADYSVQAFDIGSVYHHALKELAQRLTLTGVAVTDPASPWMTTSEEERDRMMEEILEEDFTRFREGLLRSGKEESYRAERLRLLCKTAGRVLVEQVRKGAIEGMAYEVPFGRGREIPPLTLRARDGRQIVIEGTIDRVDTLPGDRVKVIDYKSQHKKYREEEARAGMQLQLFLYLSAASGEKGHETAHKEPIGAFYFPVDAPLLSGEGVSARMEEKLGGFEKVIERNIRRQLRMNGFMVERADVLADVEGALDEDNKGTVVPVKYVKNPKDGTGPRYDGEGAFFLLKEEDFRRLLQEVGDKVDSMAKDIAGGRIDIAPKRVSHERSACTYCAYRGVCKFDVTLPECRYVPVSP